MYSVEQAYLGLVRGGGGGGEIESFVYILAQCPYTMCVIFWRVFPMFTIVGLDHHLRPGERRDCDDLWAREDDDLQSNHHPRHGGGQRQVRVWSIRILSAGSERRRYKER